MIFFRHYSLFVFSFAISLCTSALAGIHFIRSGDPGQPFASVDGQYYVRNGADVTCIPSYNDPEYRMTMAYFLSQEEDLQAVTKKLKRVWFEGGFNMGFWSQILDESAIIPIPPSKHELRSHYEPLELRWNSSQ